MKNLLYLFFSMNTLVSCIVPKSNYQRQESLESNCPQTPPSKDYMQRGPSPPWAMGGQVGAFYHEEGKQRKQNR